MFKKSLASVVSAAVLVAGPGHLTLTAAAQTMNRGAVTGVTVTPTIGNGLNSPVPGASSFNMPALTPGLLATPGLTDASRLKIPVPMSLAPVAASLAERPLPAAAKAMPVAAAGSPLAVIRSQDPKTSAAEKGAALNALFENSRAAAPEALSVLGRDAASVETGLSRAEAASAKSPVAIERAALAKGRAAGSLSDLGNLIKRAWNAVLGMLGIGVKKMETPEVMAQRIIDQLNAAKPVYNRKVKEASTLVEALKLQVEGETKKVAELEQGITALLSDSDPSNDVMASGMINQQKTLNASIASTNEQIALAEKTLEGIKEERARFFSEREETIAKIQAGLTKSAAADIQKQIAELKGGFSVGDLKDNMDKFEDAVNDKVADAKGTVDSVESNPDQVLKKAKDSLKSQEIQDEIAKRKAAIEQAKKDKGQAGGGVLGTMKAVGVAVNVVMAVWAGLNTGWIAMLLGAGAVMGVVMPLASIGGIALGVFAEKVMKTSGAKTAGMALLGGVIGFGLGVVAVGIGGYVGFAVASPAAAIGLGATALVTSLLDVAFKSIFKKDKPAAPSTDDKGAAGGKIGSYPPAVYILGTLGLAVALVMPVTALTIVAVLGALTLLDNLSAAGNLDKSTKFFAFSIGAGVAALATIGLSSFGTAFFLAGGAAVLANALGKVHKAIYLKKTANNNDDKPAAGGLILELGIGAAVIAVLAAVSAPFRNLLARAWNALLGMLGLGVKKMETPEVMAQRIIDQLNAQKPVYNRKVQEASTLVEKLRLQIEKQEAQSAELDRSVTAILSDSDPLNDVMAESLLNQKKTVDASTVLTKEQLVLSEKTLADIKEERARFFSEREEMLAKIQAGLTKSKSAEIQKQIAELKGGFQIGDLKDNMDKFEDAVNDKVADAKGTADSVESNPDQVLKKAKDALKNQEVQDEIAKRKAAIEAAKKAKGSAGGLVSSFGLLPLASLTGLAALGWLSLGGVVGFVAFAGASLLIYEHIAKVQWDINRLFFAAIAWGVLGAVIGGVASVLLFI
jgi:phage shock protein A